MSVGDMLRWFDKDDRRKTLRLFLLALLVLGSGLGLRDPWPPGEPALALMMRDFAQGTYWLIPYLGGAPFSDHPPLYIWIGALITQLTGSLRLGFLLPSLLSALGMLWLVFDLGRKLWGPRAGRLAGLVLLCSFQFTVQAHKGQVDVLFAFCVTLGLYGLVRYLLVEPQPRWLVYAGLGIGLGMLTKGAGYIAALVLLPWMWMRVQGWQELPPRGRMRDFWPVPVVALGLVLTWALPALAFVQGADTSALNQFRRELTINLLGGADLLLGGPQKALWYLPLQALVLWMPLTLLLPWLAPVWRQRLRDRDPRTALMVGYVLAVLLFFTVLPGRHGVQILPALPAVALLVGANLGGTWWRPGVQWMSRGILIGIGLLFLVLVAQARLRPAEFGLLLPPDTPFGLYWGLGVLGLIALILALAFRFGTRNQALALPVFFGVGWFLFGWGVYPWLNNIRTPETLMDRAEVVLGDTAGKAEIGMLDWRAQFPLFTAYPVHKLDLAEPRRSVREFCASSTAGHPRAVLMSSQDQREFELTTSPLLAPPEVLGVRHNREWILARCRLPGGA